MFTNNPFAELSASISPSVQQTYIIVMVILVVVGTVYDTLHKKSAVYFWNNWRKSAAKGTQKVGGGEMVSIAIKTAIENRPPPDYVWIPGLRDRNRGHGVLVSDA
jgi:hypothetical protein